MSVQDKIKKDIIVDVYVLCYNEDKIIKFALDYFSQFATNVYVLDNESTDNSIELLKKEKRFNVEIINYESNNELNDSIYLDLKNNIWKRSIGKCDFVVICDMDEMLFSPNIMNELRYMKENDKTICFPNIYNMISNTFPEYNSKLLHTIVKNGVYNPEFGKKILFNPNLINEINYTPGCHSCNPSGVVNYYDRNNIYLFHFKLLSIDYVLDRKNMYANRMSKINKENGWGFQYVEEENKTINFFNDYLKISSDITDKIDNTKKVFIDGGARIGESIHMLLKKRPDMFGCDVYLFECNPNHKENLENLIIENKNYNFYLRQDALWNKNEEKYFYITNDIWGDLGCTLKREKKEKFDNDKVYNVNCIKTSEFIFSLNKEDYIILKLDIEGAEYEVLDDLIETGAINMIKELYVEFHDNFFEHQYSIILKEKLNLIEGLKCNFDWE